MTDLSALHEITSWRMLIVDDEPDNLRLASEFLAYSGATVETTESGAKLLELVDVFKPNVIVLDLSMPVIDGWEIQQQLRARPELNHIPIIALTAMAMPEDAARAKAAGFDGYITKPFRVSSLLRDLRSCMTVFVKKHAAAHAADVPNSLEHAETDPGEDDSSAESADRQSTDAQSVSTPVIDKPSTEKPS
jgi:two-component system cell cycle response regulator DivK